MKRGKEQERCSALCVLVKTEFQQGRREQRLHRHECLLLSRIRAARPFFEMKRDRSMQKPNSLNIQIELECGEWFRHPFILR